MIFSNQELSIITWSIRMILWGQVWILNILESVLLDIWLWWVWGVLPSNDMKNVNDIETFKNNKMSKNGRQLTVLQTMSKVRNPIQRSICGETRWLDFNGGVCGGRLWGSKVLSKNSGHWPVSLPEVSLCRGCFSRILLVEIGWLVALYMSNVYVTLSFCLIFSNNF